MCFTICGTLCYNFGMEINYHQYESPTGPGGPLITKNTNPEQENEPNSADEAEALKYTRRESLSDELISGAETAEELFVGLRQLEKQLEDGNIPPDLNERYTPPRQLSAMYERADMLHYSVDELLKRGWVTELKDKGYAILKDRRFAALAIHSDVTEKPGKPFAQQEIKYYLGETPEERENLEKAYRRAITELEARSIMGEHIGVRLAIDIRDSLEELTRIMHSGRMPKFKPDHLESIFNMPDIKELTSNPENTKLGDQVEEAMFCNLIMLNSGTKQRMLDFLARPGAAVLIKKMADEKGQTEEEWKKENIGDVKNDWVDDSKRLLTDKGDVPATWRLEAGEKKRGTLTAYSNIAAWGGGPGEFGSDKEKKFIETTIGGLVGSVEASWVAAAMMRVTGTYASEGFVTLPGLPGLPGQYLLPLGEGRFISGDDTGKFYAYLFNMKEGLKGRSSGSKDMIGRIPDLAMNLFDWAQVEVDDVPRSNTNGTKARRSIWDAWLGTPAGKPIIDLLTGKPTGKTTEKEEPYHRLGSVNFKSLEREFHGTFTIMQWLMGNGEYPTGVWIDAQKSDCKTDDFELNELKKRIKYIGITMNPVVLTKGSAHLYDLGKVTEEKIQTYDLSDVGEARVGLYTIKSKNVETIQRRFFRNLMSAKMRSFSFLTKVIPQTLKIVNTGATGPAFWEASWGKVAELFVNEAAKENPDDELDLIGHYVDDVARLENLIKMGDLTAVRVRARDALTNEVGRVTGKVF